MIYKFKEFLLEGLISKIKKSVIVSADVYGSEHFYDRLCREDSEPDENGIIIISEEEVIDTINRAIKGLVEKNIFNSNMWKNDKLIKNIYINDNKTKLNIIVGVSKFINNDGETQYRFDVITVIRKKNFNFDGNTTTKIFAR